MAQNAPSPGLTAVYRRATQLWKRHRHLNWAMADQGMVSAVNFLTGLLLARYLGLAEFGRYTLAWMAVEFLQSVQHSLVIAPMMSIGPKTDAERRRFYFGAVFSSQAIFTVLSVSLFVASFDLLTDVKPEWKLDGLLLPLTVAAFASQAQNFVRRYLFTCNRGEVAFFNDFVRYGGQISVLIALFLTTKLDAGDCLLIVASLSAASAVIGGFSFEAVGVRAGVFRETIRQHWDFAKWLMSSEIFRWASGNLFILVSGALLGPVAVGAIRAAQNLVGLCHVLLLGLENVIPVRAARTFHERGAEALLDLIKRVGLWGALVVGGIVLVAAVAPEFWLHLFYGSEYADYGNLVQWWAAVYFVGFFNLPAMFGLRAIESTQAIFAARFSSAVFTALAVYPLVAFLGVDGVMIGNLCVVMLMSGVLYRNLFRRLSVRCPEAESAGL